MAFRYFGHILFRDRKPDFTAEEPVVVDKDLSPEDRFTFIDVIPGVTKQSVGGFHVGTKRESIQYHSFSALVEASNAWLSKNPDWEVINCETVLLFFKHVEPAGCQLVPDDTCFPLDGEANSSVMGLRLWIKRRDAEELEQTETSPDSPRLGHQVLKFMDFIPKTDDKNDCSRFEKLDVVIERANKAIQDGQLKGKIITIESLFFPANADWQIDPEMTLHLFPTKCVSIIRIFYEEGSRCKDLIGIKDFVPKHIAGGGFFKKPEFEPLSDCIRRASDWLSATPEFDLKNAQCLEIKIKSYSNADTSVMSHSADRGDYIRIFRVAYTKAIAASLSPPPPPIYLSSVIFTPAGPEATVPEIKRKITEWVLATALEIQNSGDEVSSHRPRLLSAETVEIFAKDFSEDVLKAETENTFQFNRIGSMNSFLYMAFRVYFDVGFYGKNRGRSRSICSTVSTKHKVTGCQMI